VIIPFISSPYYDLLVAVAKLLRDSNLHRPYS
jgi:ABC-type phosphate transport system permease subunit